MHRSTFSLVPSVRHSLAAVAIAIMTATSASDGFAADAFQASAQASKASALSAASTVAVVVVGSLETLALSGRAVVASVEAVGDGSIVVLRGVAQGGAVATSASIHVAGAVSVAAGTVVEVVTTTTGCALMAAGRMIAFVPNEVGRGLIRQSHATAAR